MIYSLKSDDSIKAIQKQIKLHLIIMITCVCLALISSVIIFLVSRRENLFYLIPLASVIITLLVFVFTFSCFSFYRPYKALLNIINKSSRGPIDIYEDVDLLNVSFKIESYDSFTAKSFKITNRDKEITLYFEENITVKYEENCKYRLYTFRGLVLEIEKQQ